MAMVIPLITLAAIAVVLFLAWPRTARRVPMSGEDIVRSNALILRGELSHVPFGEAFVRRLWQRLWACPPGEGHVRAFHRDFCGHALIRTEIGVMLCDAQDGGVSYGPAIAEWNSQAEFVAFFARQTDYSCSGWDGSEPIFATDDEWYRDNQRLTRETLEAFMAKG